MGQATYVNEVLGKADTQVLNEGILALEVVQQHKILHPDVVVLVPLGAHRSVVLVSHT
jgi:hypothetical protein